MLARMIYVSEAAAGTSFGEVEAILKVARRKNHANDISGMLLFDRQSFLQCLEGDAEKLTRLIGSLASDARHQRMKILHFGAASERHFCDWTMGFAGESANNRSVYLRHTASSHFLPQDLHADNALALLLGMARHASSTSASD
jgi:hypothetical protein